MTEIRLLKRIEGLELWSSVGSSCEHFAVKTADRRARVVATLEEAEALFQAKLGRMREARAH